MTGTILARGMLVLGLCASVSLAACRGEGDADTDTDTMPATTNDTNVGMPDAADTTGAAGTAPANAAMSDANIVARLAMMDSAEIELGKLAGDKAQNADVKAYARMMVEHHTAMKNEGAAMAQKEGITPVMQPDDPTPQEMAAARDRLMSADAASFDRTYVDQMVADHQKAVSTLTSLMTQAQSAGLRAHMEKGLPIVQGHLDQAMQLQTKVAGTATR
jgi:putative membrane protein